MVYLTGFLIPSRLGFLKPIFLLSFSSFRLFILGEGVSVTGIESCFIRPTYIYVHIHVIPDSGYLR